MLHGVLLMALFACASFAIGDLSFVKHLSFSPMIVGKQMQFFGARFAQ